MAFANTVTVTARTRFAGQPVALCQAQPPRGATKRPRIAVCMNIDEIMNRREAVAIFCDDYRRVFRDLEALVYDQDDRDEIEAFITRGRKNCQTMLRIATFTTPARMDRDWDEIQRLQEVLRADATSELSRLGLIDGDLTSQ